MQTAATHDFIARVSDTSHLLLVADEVHHVGSPKNRKLLTLETNGRLGLSATPERYGDPQGTQAVLNYFAPTLQPPFGLLEAIDSGRLCPYTYYTHDVRLTLDETEDWKRLSADIGKAIGIDSIDSGQQSERLRWLLIKRARLLKQASGKPACAVTEISSRFETGQSWLVYCDDQDQLREVIGGLEAMSLPVYEYHSTMLGDRSSTLGYFADRGGIVVAIRCLDEGVDIPQVTHAFILASSRNTREFIQRRGRVLRKFPGKSVAEIHDVICLPDDAVDASLEARFVAPELSRALLFAKDSWNKGTEARLLSYALALGIDVRAQDIREAEDDD